ncbi:suppressor of tub2 mutation [Recurvomyces mirabilis]|nr:suppressor of tub2 mutation [Recurvomyces mirabilis]
MEAQVANLLSLLKRPAISSSTLVESLNALKSDIKRHVVPDRLQGQIFEVLRLAITQQTSSSLALSACSTLGHLIKRLKIQSANIDQLAPRVLPAVQERLGDLKEPVRAAASQALSELYPYLTQDIEHVVREESIGGSNARAKEAGMQWVVRMHREENMAFKSYVSPMVARLEDSDGNVREAAKSALVDLFSNAPDRAKTDLKKQLKAHGVRHSIQTQILSQIGAETASRPQTAQAHEEQDLAASTRSLPATDHATKFAQSINSEAAQPTQPEIVQMEPLYVHSRGELDDMFRDMLPHFEGKEDEHNWTLRDKSVTKVRRLLTGNAPNEYHVAFMAGLKSVIEGILKVANSLRTTMSSNGSQAVQDFARILGPALDTHVEILLQNFIKTCANTKPIAFQNGRQTCDSIFQHCSYHVRMMQHIWAAAQEKNAQVRSCVPDWLKIVLKRQAGYKSHFESSGGLDLAEKCIRKGLDDAKPAVKEGTRAAYWNLARTWSERADKIMSSLDEKSKTALQKDSNNPNSSLHASVSSMSASTSRPGGSTSMALREKIAEQRRAKAAGALPDRPNSAMATMSPSKPKSRGELNPAKSHLRHETRVVSTASTTSETPSEAKAPASKSRSALMSGPVRRPRRPELARPQTADPYASRQRLRPETPSNATPANSPPKGTGASSKTSVPSTSVIRNRAKTAGQDMLSPNGSPIKRSPAVVNGHSVADRMQDVRPSSKGSDDSTSVREDDFTMVMPTSRSATSARSAMNGGFKRPALEQTMSVDSGVQAARSMAEDDGFTMVIPALAHDNSSRARSPLAVRSPLKAMFEEARHQLERSGSPPAPRERLGGIEEALEAGTAAHRQDSPVKPKTPQPEEIQIYEDSFHGDAPESLTDGERKVLSEIQVNENVRVTSPAQSQGSSASPAGSPTHAPEARSPAVQPPQDRAEVLRSRRLLGSGIERIRTRSLDAHGFRRMQDLAKSPLDIWDGGSKYDELMAALLDYLPAFDQDTRLTQQPAHKSSGLKAQALGLIRALLLLQRKSAASWHAKALTTMYTSVSGAEGNTHVLSDLDKTIDDIIRVAAPEVSVDATLAYLEPGHPNEQPLLSPRIITKALTTLRRLLNITTQRSVQLGSYRHHQLTVLASKYLDAEDRDVRKADMEFASELFVFLGGEEERKEFWGAFRGVDEGRLGLLTYFIARRTQQVSS